MSGGSGSVRSGGSRVAEWRAIVRGGLAVLVSLAIASTIAWLSNAVVPAQAQSALIRLSWRTQPIRVETCRLRTEEELARLAPHMRQAEVCEGGYAEYELTYSVDGGGTVVDTLVPSGARRDRPIYVLRDLTVDPGRHAVVVGLAALVDDSVDIGGEETSFEWSGTVTVGVREIGLITMDDDGGRLVLR